MRSRLILVLGLLAMVLGPLVAAPSAGASISVFVPETLMTSGQGGISFEQGFSTSLGLGGLLGIPLGFDYYEADGWRFSGTGASSTTGPAFYGDVLEPFVGLSAKLAAGPVFVTARGGGLASWSFRFQPVGQALESALAASGENVSISALSATHGIGYGYFAGGGFGVTIGQVSVELGADWRYLQMPVTLDATLVRVTGTTATSSSLSLKDGLAVLQGLSCRLGGSFAF